MVLRGCRSPDAGFSSMMSRYFFKLFHRPFYKLRHATICILLRAGLGIAFLDASALSKLNGRV